MDEALKWIGRILKFVPVFQKLWTAVADRDEGALLAAQMEFVTRVREQQAREEFLYDLSDEPTAPGGQ